MNHHLVRQLANQKQLSEDSLNKVGELFTESLDEELKRFNEQLVAWQESKYTEEVHPIEELAAACSAALTVVKRIRESEDFNIYIMLDEIDRLCEVVGFTGELHWPKYHLATKVRYINGKVDYEMLNDGTEVQIVSKEEAEFWAY